MKYRIKKSTFNTGQVLYYAQVKTFFGWKYLWLRRAPRSVQTSFDKFFADHKSEGEAAGLIEMHKAQAHIIESVSYINI